MDDGRIDTIVLRWQFKCTQNILMNYSCERNLLVHRMGHHLKNLASSEQILTDQTRLSSQYYGYSLRSFSTLKVEKIGVANCFITLAMAYMMSKLTRNFIIWFFILVNKSEGLMSQLKYQLDLSRHLKED